MVAATFPSLAIKGIRKALRDSKEELSELQRAKRTLEESEVRYRLLVDGSPDAIFIHDDSMLTYVNPVGLKLVGVRSLAEAVGKSLFDFLHPESRSVMSDDLSALPGVDGPMPLRRAKVVRPDGSPRQVEAVRCIADHSGKPHIQTIMRDVTKQAILEGELLQSQKLAALGQMVGEVAHDLSNIMGHTDLMEKWRTDPDRFSKSFQAARTAGSRGAGLVKQLLAFARKDESVKEPVAVNKAVEEVAGLLKETFPERISLRLRLVPTLPEIHADPNQLYQVLLNLCVNARDAMPSGGILTISTSRIDEYAPKERFADADAREYVAISVADTGVGIETEVIGRIFEPFFTTKRDGHGTGLGLSVVSGIVKAHNGFIDVRSEVGHGAEFLIYLPVTDHRSDAARVVRNENGPGG